MKFKNIFLFACILLLIATVGIASASENTTRTDISTANDTNPIDVELNEDDAITSENTTNALKDDEITYSSMQTSKDSISAKAKSAVSTEVFVYDQEDTDINNGFVSIKIDGIEYKSNVKYGVAKLNFKMPSAAGSKNYRINYHSQTSDITDSYTYIKLNSKIATKIIVKSVSGYQGTEVKLKATLKTDSNKVLEGYILTFNFNGKTYKAKTNSKGVAQVIVVYPTAKYLKTVEKTNKNILTKTNFYKKTYTCKVTFNGKGDYEKSSANLNVTSQKKPKVTKYQYVKYKEITVPFKSGQHLYNRGTLLVVTGDIYEGGIYYIVIAVLNKKTNETIKISTKLHSKHPNGKWYWDSSWKKYIIDEDVIGVLYKNKKNPINKIKIRYYAPHYKLIY